MAEPFTVRVDGGGPDPAENLRSNIGAWTWAFADVAGDGESRWELTETAVSTVLFVPGEHELDVAECPRASYPPFPTHTRFVRAWRSPEKHYHEKKEK